MWLAVCACVWIRWCTLSKLICPSRAPSPLPNPTKTFSRAKKIGQRGVCPFLRAIQSFTKTPCKNCVCVWIAVCAWIRMELPKLETVCWFWTFGLYARNTTLSIKYTIGQYKNLNPDLEVCSIGFLKKKYDVRFMCRGHSAGRIFLAALIESIYKGL